MMKNNKSTDGTVHTTNLGFLATIPILDRQQITMMLISLHNYMNCLSCTFIACIFLVQSLIVLLYFGFIGTVCVISEIML